MIDAKTGRIVYSVFKELDFNTSLLTGPWSKTNFADAFRKAAALNKADDVALVDFAQYTPSYDSPAGFIASPIMEGGEMLGVLIFQMPLERISEIMSERAGLGETGETYLVGPDQLMRSDSYLDPKHHTVVASFKNPEKGKVGTKASTAALKGKTGAEIIIDYNGNPVLSAYTPVKLSGLTWGLLAEIDVAEAFVPRVAGHKSDFYADYIKKYGYYDLFLMNPDGYVFYTVTHEADYQTNMVDGKYASSGLGVLTRKALAEKTFGFADFAPYAPSNDDPAAFIAEQASSNVQTVAAAAEQLSASVQEVGRQVAKSSEIAGRAVDEADRTHNTVRKLAESAQKIGDVVQLITEIAEQTNLLALNATIEAARAGDAGKGFAVVASEVKSLASQTAKATEEIELQIGGIQDATQTAVKAIDGIGGTIGEINEITSTIASAVEEQGAATQEIARNTHEAATGTQQVTSTITDVSQSAGEAGSASAQVLSAAGQLSEESEMLRSEVDKFIARIRA